MASEESDHVLLQKTYKLVQESNTELHKMRRAQKIKTFLNVLYWLIIIGVSIGAYYYIQPYIESLSGTVSGLRSGIESLGGTGEQAQGGIEGQIKGLLEGQIKDLDISSLLDKVKQSQ